MEQHSSNKLSVVLGGGLALSGALLAFFGCLGIFLPHPTLTVAAAVAFASLMAFGIACANVAADVAVRAIRRGAWDALILGALTCCAFAVASNIGIHLGWEMLVAPVGPDVKLPPKWQVDLGFYVLCAGKPLIAALTAYARLFAAEDAAAEKQRRDARYDAAEARRMGVATQPAPEPVMTPPARPLPQRVASASVHNIATERAARERPTEAEIMAAARDMVAAGLRPSIRTLAARLQCPTSRIERGPQTWRALMAPAGQAELLMATNASAGG